MYLMIAEVSQKQAYIFSSLKLRDNIKNSQNIEEVLSEKYFEKFKEYSPENFVYSGGGHSVLSFDDKESALSFSKALTTRVIEEFEGMELFVKLMEYKFNKGDDENKPGIIVERLCKELEVKKSLRRTSFIRKSYGIDKIEKNEYKERQDYELYDDNFYLAKNLEELGGTEGDKSFIAIVHIDGNSMGERVKKLRSTSYGTNEKSPWEDFKEKSKEFSEHIDKSFKQAFKEMVAVIISNIKKGKLGDIELKTHKDKPILPIRKLILAGDDVCFVCDGRIGLECGDIFMKKLKKIEPLQGEENYFAAAGVCIVHSKFPFHRAYNMAESLCNSAKKFIADNGAKACAIDWHIEYGEMESSLSMTREMYKVKDGDNRINLLLRPYFVDSDNEINYDNFKKILLNLEKKTSDIPRSKMKGLRDVLRKGMDATDYFIITNKIKSILVEPINTIYGKDSRNITRLQDLKGEEGIFIKVKNEYKCVVFDAIDSMDMFIPLDGSSEEVKK